MLLWPLSNTATPLCTDYTYTIVCFFVRNEGSSLVLITSSSLECLGSKYFFSTSLFSEVLKNMKGDNFQIQQSAYRTYKNCYTDETN